MINRKYKILFISHSSKLTGAPLALYQVVKNINPEVFESETVFPEEGEAVKLWNDNGLKTNIINNPEKGFSELGMLMYPWLIYKRFAYFVMLFVFLLRNKIDIVYVNSSVNIPAGLAPFLLRVGVVWHLHESFKRTLKNRIKCFMISMISERIILASPTSGELFSKKTMRRAKIIFNGIKLDQFEHAEYNEDILKEMNINPENRTVVFSGYISEIKGIDILVEAAKEIVAAHENTVFIIAGDIPLSSVKYAEKVSWQIKKNNLEKHFVFAGFRNDIPNLLKLADVFVLPSRSEACPISLIEAMAAGCAIVATSAGCVEQLLDYGECGLIVPIEDAKKLSEAIISLLDDKDVCQRLSDKALIRSYELFRIEHYVDSVEKTILSAAERKS